VAPERHIPSVLQNQCQQRARTIIPVGPCQAAGIFDFSHVAGQFPALENFVESVADWDVPDSKIARDLAITIFPSTTPYLVVQYRVPMRSSRKFGDVILQHRQYQHVATMVRTGIVTIRPDGPLGAVIVRLRPETAACLLGDHMDEFGDVKIDLGAVFDAGEVSLLAEMLAECRASHDRIVAVLRFLLANLRRFEPDRVVYRAVANLRNNPAFRVRLLAAELGLSERHLSRKFRTVFGASPKQFARAARVERIMEARGGGSAWADIAYSCGFADQAHMINDFRAIFGTTPDKVFRSLLVEQYRDNMTATPSSP